MGGRPENLDFLLSMIPDGSTWSVAGIGRWELPLAYHAIELGGHVRVGLEDNIYVAKGQLAKGSWELVGKVAKRAEECGRPLHTPTSAAQMLQIAR
jgi:3-keto-5-aminohexanoate cleavage enzyme